MNIKRSTRRAQARTHPGMATATVLLGSLLMSTTALASPLEWNPNQGGNGHWYMVVNSSNGYEWNEAVAKAESMGGYLVSITSPEEDSWVYENLDGYGRWMGGWQDIAAPDYSEPSGGWKWLSGEEWSYTHWNGGSPDNNGVSEPNEEYLSYCCSGAWNDIYYANDAGVLTRKNLIVEWSADCNGDGIVDYGQILDGSLEDLDGNGVPDLCDGAPIQWTMGDGGNDHWYQSVTVGPYLSWQEAWDLASARGGHLATPVTEEEDLWIINTLLADDSLWGHNNNYAYGPHIGGWQNFDSPDYSEPGGGWEWFSGETFDYTNWVNLDNCCGGQARMQYFKEETDGVWDIGWDDVAVSGSEVLHQSYVIEWSADCNGDGMVDYGQILDGSLEDLDGNGIPDCCDASEPCDCSSDVDNDGEVNVNDVLIVIAEWGTSNPLGDPNGDGIVDVHDVLQILSDYGMACP